MRKTYSTGKVEYRSVGKKWSFLVPTLQFELLQVCPGGFETAEKVATAITSSVLRTKGKYAIDGTARTVINKACNPPKREIWVTI